MTLTYTGVGSRETPKEVQAMMEAFAFNLAARKWTLRSGHAGGADLAFEHGCNLGKGLKEIYIPWKGFNDSRSPYYTVCDRAKTIASEIHPRFENCTAGAQKLHGRNVYQVLGLHLNDPSNFLICWTPKGGIVGGTATAIRLAQKYGVQIFNLGLPGPDATLKAAIRWAADSDRGKA